MDYIQGYKSTKREGTEVGEVKGTLPTVAGSAVLVFSLTEIGILALVFFAHRVDDAL